MSPSIVLKSFQELAAALDCAALPPGPSHPADEPQPQPQDGTITIESVEDTQTAAVASAADDLPTLLGRLAAAAEALSSARHQDAEAREHAERELERHAALLAEAEAAEQALRQARQVRAGAEALLADAFDDTARATASEVLELAVHGERAAEALLATRRQEAATLETRPAIQRVLEERRRQAEREAEEQKAAELEAARRLSDGLARASQALGQGQVEEAEALLGHLSTDYPDSADVASLLHTIAHERWLVKAQAADQALREARKVHRHDPRRAIALVEPLDLSGLPDALARQLFGLWARCHALLQKQGALIEPLRYAPDPGRGLILARERPNGAYVVSGALGMGSAWRPGAPVPERVVRRARPLR